MKHSFLIVATLLWFSGLAYSQEKKPDTDIDTALRIYKERVSEGAAPTLILKGGEAKITETALRGELTATPTTTTTATTGKEFAPPIPSVVALEIQALKAEVEALKKLNAALEKELANCKPNP